MKDPHSRTTDTIWMKWILSTNPCLLTTLIWPLIRIFPIQTWTWRVIFNRDHELQIIGPEGIKIVLMQWTGFKMCRWTIWWIINCGHRRLTKKTWLHLVCWDQTLGNTQAIEMESKLFHQHKTQTSLWIYRQTPISARSAQVPGSAMRTPLWTTNIGWISSYSKRFTANYK